MKVHETPLPGLMVIETTPSIDDRGRFVRAFCEKELTPLRRNMHFPQINVSTTLQRGTVRGLHFQYPPAAEAKLIRCLTGRVFDVAVDLRAGSPTFLKWHGVDLSENGETQFYIPEGFAHGFQALTDDVRLLYMHTASWSKAHESRLRYCDERVAIEWPLKPANVSDADRNAPLLDDNFVGVRL